MTERDIQAPVADSEGGQWPDFETVQSIKVIERAPMQLGEYMIFCGQLEDAGMSYSEIISDKDPEADGYLIRYQDGYHSWCPKNVAEETHKPI